MKKNSTVYCFLDRAAQSGTVAKGNGRQAISMRSRRRIPSGGPKNPSLRTWIFLSIAKAMVYHQPSGCISSRSVRPTLYIITPLGVYQKFFRNDDILAKSEIYFRFWTDDMQFLTELIIYTASP